MKGRHNVYNENVDQQIDTNASLIFHGKNFFAWEAAKKGSLMYKKLLDMGKNSNFIPRRKNLWYSLLRQKHSEMAFTLYSGKK